MFDIGVASFDPSAVTEIKYSQDQFNDEIKMPLCIDSNGVERKHDFLTLELV